MPETNVLRIALTCSCGAVMAQSFCLLAREQETKSSVASLGWLKATQHIEGNKEKLANRARKRSSSHHMSFWDCDKQAWGGLVSALTRLACSASDLCDAKRHQLCTDSKLSDHDKTLLSALVRKAQNIANKLSAVARAFKALDEATVQQQNKTTT